MDPRPLKIELRDKQEQEINGSQNFFKGALCFKGHMTVRRDEDGGAQDARTD